MNWLRGTFASTLGTAMLVLAAYWFARSGDGDGQLPSSDASASGRGSLSSIRRLEWSADGQVLLALSRGYLFDDGALRLCNARGMDLGQSSVTSRRSPESQLLLDIGDIDLVTSAAIDPNGLRVLAGTSDGRVLWLSAGSAEMAPRLELPRPAGITSVAVAPDGSRVAAASSDGRIFVVDAALDEAPRWSVSPSHMPNGASDLRFSRDSRRLAGVAPSGWVGCWDVAGDQLDLQFAAHDGPATAVFLFPDGLKVITAGWDNCIRIFSLPEGREEWTWRCERGSVNALALSPDGRTCAWGGFTHEIIAWDIEHNRQAFRIATPSSAVLQLAFSPDGQILAAAGSDHLIRRYNASTGRELAGIRVE